LQDLDDPSQIDKMEQEEKDKVDQRKRNLEEKM
jgi:hypothetical protein